METDVHGGLPQHRSRIYIVGIRADCEVKDFVWPTEVPVPLNLSQVLGPGTCSETQQLAALLWHANETKLNKTILKNFQAFAEVLEKKPSDYILDVQKNSCSADSATMGFQVPAPKTKPKVMASPPPVPDPMDTQRLLLSAKAQGETAVLGEELSSSTSFLKDAML